MTRRLLAFGLAGPLFLLVVLVEGALRPGYEPMHRYPSELSNGDWGWIQSANFLATGLALLVFAVGLRHALGGGRGSWAAPILAGIGGASLVMAGIFPMDPAPGFPIGSTGTPDPTLAGSLHGWAPILFFVSLTALAGVMAWHFAAEPGGRRWMWASIATAAIMIVTFQIGASMYDFEAQTGRYHGLCQLIALALGLGWLGAIVLWAQDRRTLPANA